MNPEEEYSRRLELRRAREAHYARRERTISNSRLGVFLVGVGVAWAALGSGAFSAWWLVLPTAVFGALVFVHDNVIRSRSRARRAVAFYESGLARLQDRFAGTGNPGARFLDPGHPYARDLDLFGSGSLFELLCAARTRMGENALAAWLKAPGPPDRIRSRQQAVSELRPGLDLREDLAVSGGGEVARVDPTALAGWSTAPGHLPGRGMKLLAAVCSFLTLSTLAAWGLAGTGPWPFAAAATVQSVLALALRPRVRAVVEAAEAPGRDLAQLARILGRFERETFTCEHLRELRSALETGGVAPSIRVAALARIVDRLDWSRNQIFAVAGAFLLWKTQCALAIEKWRDAYGKTVPLWISTVGQLEALVSLAGYGYEHPSDPFPEVRDSEVLFDATGIGHPLLPEARVIRNDVRLDADMRLLVVSGSNMSGKSTLLRTVGINAVLALAGAPVRAERLRLSPVAVGATLRIQDSLREGSSRFYAEIKRMRQLVEIAEGPLPLLFLLDEIFHGTNSHDRRIGAEAVVRELAERGAIGLITTHDLALSDIAERLAPRARNVHFEDHLENGRVAFDFKLREGVVENSNALELMRSIGLDV